MPSAARRSFGPAAVAGLSLLAVVTSACVLPAGARAAGFSGSFDPANWSIVNTTNGVKDQILTSNGSPPLSQCRLLLRQRQQCRLCRGH